jgi:hypothetical protein
MGPKGDTGATGAEGPKGAPGRDAVTTVAALPSHGWSARETTCGADGDPVGGASIAGGHGQLGPFTDGNAAAGLALDVNGAKLGDVAYFAYSAEYDQATDAHGGTPYLIVKTTGGHSVVFSPNTQAGKTVAAGRWQRWTVTDGTARYDDDEGTGVDASWESIVAAHAGESIATLSIQAGCAGGYSDGTTARVDNVEVDLAGERAVYDFGS